MHNLKVLLAGEMIVGVADVGQDLVPFALRQSMGGQHVAKVGLIPVTEWTTSW